MTEKKLKPKYKHLRFKNDEAFQEWLEKTAKYKVEFEDDGQDFDYWWIDERGEILHSAPFQSSIWSGKFVFTNTIVEGEYLMFEETHKCLIHRTIKVEVLN